MDTVKFSGVKLLAWRRCQGATSRPSGTGNEHTRTISRQPAHNGRSTASSASEREDLVACLSSFPCSPRLFSRLLYPSPPQQQNARPITRDTRKAHRWDKACYPPSPVRLRPQTAEANRRNLTPVAPPVLPAEPVRSSIIECCCPRKSAAAIAGF